ncbi:peroxidase 2-like [Selaginella moellendorffii]|uniref:peroxidase 2-like n=1 Tax=Selaginella moellendorffii TaxID=88036 RepID=UPI000D1C70A7|nr:peroxidase 2-like [Selaginella moellendorffii]|eukprot:XP_024542634.1 peroxidase 2-like [Selaginella moellendorffii]
MAFKIFATLFLVIAITGHYHARASMLDRDFYNEDCPEFEMIVAATVQSFLNRDHTVPPGLLRLVFHDAFVGGLDSSVMLNSSSGPDPPERDARPNLSLHGFEVIDAIKEQLEEVCPETVSCSDILALAARDAVALGALKDLPSPFENTTALLKKFRNRGFSAEEMVVLQGGGHSIGVGHCPFFRDRYSNFSGTAQPDPALNPTHAIFLKASCDPNGNAAVANDHGSAHLLDNHYFLNIQKGKGLFNSDQEFYSDSRTRKSIDKYAASSEKFYLDFIKAMEKMSELGVLTGSHGSIRTHCAIAK